MILECCAATIRVRTAQVVDTDVLDLLLRLIDGFASAKCRQLSYLSSMWRLSGVILICR